MATRKPEDRDKPSANDMLMDEAIRHQIDLARYSNGLVRRMVAILNRADARLFAELTAALFRLDPESFTVERLESMLGSVRAMNAQAYSQIEQSLRQELRDFVEYESAYQTKALVSVVPVQVHVASVTADTIYTAALSRPFQGVLLKGVLSDMEAGRARKIRQAIALGFTEGKTTDQIIRELRGTRAKGYSDGLMESPRRDIAAVTQTALGHMAGFVQDRHMEANADITKAIKWSSKLDLRTSEPCRLRDGKLYEPVTHKPIDHSYPWGQGPGRFHWNCRSAQVSILKSWREMGIDLEGSPNLEGTRASMDGQVPNDVTYADWIKRQPAARQDDVLGPTRGALLRKGGLSLENMYTNKGAYKTLEQLRQSDADAFRRAGV